MTTPRLLIVDDEKIAIKNLAYVMTKEGYEVVTANSGANALRLLEQHPFDVVLTDLKMEKVDGMGILEACRRCYPQTEVIIITGFSTLASAVEAIKRGAFSYLAKPFRLDEVRKVTAEAVEKVRKKQEHLDLTEEMLNAQGDSAIITRDSAMLRLIETARQIAPSDCNVLLTGESGVGKELFARFLHRASRRHSQSFVAINCSTFNEGVLENELFGHSRGAFTGATSERKGLIEAAHGGTLFLDEITEMPPSMQVKLLRVIQERELRRLGDIKPIVVDVRFIGATNRNLTEELRQGRLRQDFYYRMNVARLEIPPLAERKGDIPLLCNHFLALFNQRSQKNIQEIDTEALDILTRYAFPGNVRELSNIMERGVAMVSGEKLLPAHLPDDLCHVEILTLRSKDGHVSTLEEREKEYVLWVFQYKAGGNQTLAAQMLGIDRVSLWRKLKKYQAENVAVMSTR
ncbi:MAG: response regulator [Magnetococcales bacterium]|nr:response regulator [Magnetococcales bacterium]HIJ85174.1 sigma-54-dependent Fis family transcriptional regulator [Magnetococcales bacterium]